MNPLVLFNYLSRRRGISQIVGSLFMLAIVVPIGVVIVSQGLYEVADFNAFLTTTRDQGLDATREDIIFEHVRFEPGSREITISLRNISTVESIIDRITVVNVTSQELVVYNNTLTSPLNKLQLEESKDITVYAPAGTSWTKDGLNYKISVTTIRGNFFETTARPYNT